MNYVVCAKYCGSVIELESFNSMTDAENFCSHPCTLFYADELEYGEKDEVIFPREMWIEKQAKTEPIIEVETVNPYKDLEYELPF